MKADPGLALCLSSSFLGVYAHAGLLRGFEEAGVRPGRIAGASAGALAGGLWAAGVRGEALEELLVSPRFRFAFFDWGSSWRWLGVASLSYASGVFSGRRMRRLLAEHCGSRRVEELADPRLEIAVANLDRRREEVRREGPLADLLVASCAVPLLITVQKVDGEALADGGVSNESPFEHWLDDPAVHTILVHRILRRDKPRTRRWWGPIDVMGECHAVANRELLDLRVRAAKASGKRVEFLDTYTDSPGFLQSPARTRACYQAGRETAAAWAPER